MLLLLASNDDDNYDDRPARTILAICYHACDRSVGTEIAKWDVVSEHGLYSWILNFHPTPSKNTANQ